MEAFVHHVERAIISRNGSREEIAQFSQKKDACTWNLYGYQELRCEEV
jgi:hypothetical protein